MCVSAKSRDRIKGQKGNCLNRRQHSGILLFLVLSFCSERLHKLTKIYFPPAFPRPLRDHDIHLPMLVVDFCMLNVCKSVVWCGKFAKILPALYLYRYQLLSLPNRIGVFSSYSLWACFSNLPNLMRFLFVFLFFLLLIPPLCKCLSSRPTIFTERSAPSITVLASLHFQKIDKNRGGEK